MASKPKLPYLVVALLETASFLAFHEVELYRTLVRRRIQPREIYLRFSASVQLDDFVIKLRSQLSATPDR